MARPDFGRENGLRSFEELTAAGPSLSPQELSAAVLEQMGADVPAGYQHLRRLRQREGRPDVSGLREHLGLD